MWKKRDVRDRDESADAFLSRISSLLSHTCSIFWLEIAHSTYSLSLLLIIHVLYAQVAYHCYSITFSTPDNYHSVLYLYILFSVRYTSYIRKKLYALICYNACCMFFSSSILLTTQSGNGNTLLHFHHTACTGLFVNSSVFLRLWVLF